MDLDSRERALTLELKDALASTLELPVVLSRVKDALFQLLPAEHAAWCVTRRGFPSDYEWVVTDRLTAFLARYREMAGEDFVRSSGAHQPNVVFRDSEMVPREVLERSRPYQLCRELGTPLEHVMSVRLDMRQGWHGGLTLYREQLRPFSEREQALLQRLTPFLARTVRNCRILGGMVKGRSFPKALLHQRGVECLVLTPAFAEVQRTGRVTAWLETWFSPSELGSSGLPVEWMARLAWLGRLDDVGELGSDIWERPREDRSLRVTFIRMPEQDGQRLWTLVLEERLFPIPVPEAWRLLLTPREVEIVSYVLQNWFYESIAAHLRVEQNTMDTHLKNIRRKLEVESRPHLLYKAALVSQEEW
ncbi:LuxR family transcriptional regulator [Archangium gephyra]|nr:LuxR family transcriptional regulator [Archangium gephyra]